MSKQRFTAVQMLIADLEPANPAPAGNASISTILTDADGRIALGHHLLPERRFPGAEARVIQLPLSPACLDTLLLADVPTPDWLDLAAAAEVLHQHMANGRAVAHALGKRPIEVTRLLQLRNARPLLRDALSRGTLTATHVRLLAPLDERSQEEWMRRAVAGRWSVRRLTTALNRGGQVTAESADMAHFERSLSERLGAEVRLNWPEPPAPRELRIEFHGIEELKGVMEQLAAGPEGREQLSRQKRQLTIRLVDLADLDALTGHLAGGA